MGDSQGGLELFSYRKFIAFVEEFFKVEILIQNKKYFYDSYLQLLHSQQKIEKNWSHIVQDWSIVEEKKVDAEKQQEISKNIVQQNDAHSLARHQLAAICCVLMLLPFLLYVLATLLLRSRIRIFSSSLCSVCTFVVLFCQLRLSLSHTGILLFSSSCSLCYCCDATSCSLSFPPIASRCCVATASAFAAAIAPSPHI